LLVSALGGLNGLASVLLWPAAGAGIPAAVYTAFLFGQCRGRELWQCPLLAVQLLAQSVVAGGALLALFPTGLGVTKQLLSAAVYGLAIGLFVHATTVAWELFVRRSSLTPGARQAATLITSGSFRALFWGGAVCLGCLAPAALLAVSTTSRPVVGLGGAAALIGLLAFEWCFVMAGQGVPNS